MFDTPIVTLCEDDVSLELLAVVAELQFTIVMSVLRHLLLEGLSVKDVAKITWLAFVIRCLWQRYIRCRSLALIWASILPWPPSLLWSLKFELLVQVEMNFFRHNLGKADPKLYREAST